MKGRQNLSRLIYLILFLFGFFNISQGHSAIWIEPMVGADVLGKVEQDPNTEYEYDGIIYGGKLGASIGPVHFGGTYEMSSFELVQTQPAGALPANQTKQDYDATYLGGFIGAKFAMFRAYANYFFDVDLEVAEAPNVGDTYSGSGFGLGVGWFILPMLALNAEYRTFSLDEYKDASSGTTVTLTNDLSISEILVTLSVPINL